MADFTTWSALLAQMLDDLSNRDQMVASYKTPDGREVKYSSPEEWQKWYIIVKTNADAESATSGVSSRSVSARPKSDIW